MTLYRDFKEESWEEVEELIPYWDFGTCQRPDGSYYGHPGGQCRKGTEASVPEKEKKGRAPAAAKPEPTKKKAAAKPVEKVSSGSAATGTGTAHELAMLREFGIKLSDEENGILQENLKRGGPKAKEATEIAKDNVKDIKAQLKGEGKEITDVVWTAQLRGDGLAKAAGVEGLNERNNQSDILLKVRNKDGSEETIGVSLKVNTSGKYPQDIPFYNGGLQGLSDKLGVAGVTQQVKDEQASARQKLGIKATTGKAQKAEIRTTPELKAKADAAGVGIVKNARDQLLEGMKGMPPDQVRGILENMTGAPSGAGLGLRTLKVTGYAKGDRRTKIEDAVDGAVPRAIRGAAKFEFKPTGDAGFQVIADGQRVMNIRLKPESQHLVGALKTSGEP